MKAVWQDDVITFGPFKVGEVYYNGATARNDPKKYRATCRLPGIKAIIGDFEDEGEAKSKLEFICEYWIKKANGE